MFYKTQISEETSIIIEAETSGAFTKSDLEDRPDPLRAGMNTINTIAKVAQQMAASLGPALDGTGLAIEVEFGVKADGVGMVMVSQNPDGGQFKVRIVRGAN